MTLIGIDLVRITGAAYTWYVAAARRRHTARSDPYLIV